MSIPRFFYESKGYQIQRVTVEINEDFDSLLMVFSDNVEMSSAPAEIAEWIMDGTLICSNI